MGINISKNHWVKLVYETEKGLLFVYAKRYQAWFPRSCFKGTIERYEEGKLKALLLPDSEWVIVGKSWDTRKTFQNKAKAKKIPYNQTRLFRSNSEEIDMFNIVEKKKELTRKRRDTKKRMKRMRENIGKQKFRGN